MTTYYYTALDTKGERCAGEVLADNEAHAIQALRSGGYYPTRISTIPGGGMEITTGPFSASRGLPLIVRALITAAIVAAIWLVSSHSNELPAAKPTAKPAEAQTLIIDGKPYTITITPQ